MKEVERSLGGASGHAGVGEGRQALRSNEEEAEAAPRPPLGAVPALHPPSQLWALEAAMVKTAIKGICEWVCLGVIKEVAFLFAPSFLQALPSLT